jgi:thiosulfate/3-mercaptopyruvate sulfurtransferase
MIAVNKDSHARRVRIVVAMIVAVFAIGFATGMALRAQSVKPSSDQKASAEDLPATAVEQPAELDSILKSSTGEKPLILQVGFAVLYRQAHISGAEYAGPASKPEGIEILRKRLQSVPRNKFIVLYCGCCPWDHCPNVKPAYDEVRKMGFTSVKVVHMANNFGTDWVYKGYPTVKEGTAGQ